MHKVNCFPGIVITAVLLILIMVKNFHNDPHATNVVHIKEDVLDLLLGVPSSSRSSATATTAAWAGTGRFWLGCSRPAG